MFSIPWSWLFSETTAIDYSSAVVPLDEAHRHSHSYRLRPRHESRERRGDGADDDDNDDDDDDDGADKDGDEGEEGEGDTAMLVMTDVAAEYSIEGLRREVRRGRRGEDEWTAYESEYCLADLLSRWCTAQPSTASRKLTGR